MLQQSRSVQHCSSEDHGLRQDRVGVPKSSLRPGPSGVCLGWRHAVRRISQAARAPLDGPAGPESNSAAPRAANAIARGYARAPSHSARELRGGDFA